MTICIAAISTVPANEGGGNMLFCLADRMITVGDVQYEPDSAKFFEISNTIVLLPAGDYSLHSAMAEQLAHEAMMWIEMNPGSWPSVGDFADRYRRIYAERKRKVWENKTLLPEGLSVETLHKRGLSHETLDRLSKGITNNLLPDVSAIIAGIDPNGTARIFTVSNDDEAEDQTRLGFAAVGYGARHAETVFRLNRFASSVAPYDALWLGYYAKRRSEVAPSVGRALDACYFGPMRGQRSMVAEEIVEKMHELYESIEKAETVAHASARATIGSFVEARVAKPETPSAEQELIQGQDASPRIDGDDDKTKNAAVAEVSDSPKKRSARAASAKKG